MSSWSTLRPADTRRKTSFGCTFEQDSAGWRMHSRRDDVQTSRRAFRFHTSRQCPSYLGRYSACPFSVRRFEEDCAGGISATGAGLIYPLNGYSKEETFLNHLGETVLRGRTLSWLGGSSTITLKIKMRQPWLGTIVYLACKKEVRSLE